MESSTSTPAVRASSPQLAQRGLRGGAVAVDADGNEDGPFPAAHRPDRGAAGQLVLQRRQSGGQVRLFSVDVRQGVRLPVGAVAVGGNQMRPVQDARQAVLQHAHRGHQVQAQQRQVGEVVAGERLGLEVGVDQAQAAQTDLPGTGPADVRKFQLLRVPHHYLLHLALAVQQDTDLAVGLARDFREVAGQLGADNLVGGDAATVGVTQALQLAGLEPEGIAGDVVQAGLSPLGSPQRARALPGQCSASAHPALVRPHDAGRP